MKKKLLFILGCSFFLFGTSVALGNLNVQKVVAEEEIVAPIEDGDGGGDIAPIEDGGGEIIAPVDNNNVGDKISQWATDTIEVAKEILNEPLVIGGVSVSLGGIIIAVFGKLLGGINQKKLVSEINKLKENIANLKDYASKKEYDALADEVKKCVEVFNEIVPTLKNAKVKENCVKMLEELQPIRQELEKIAEKEKNDLIDHAETIVSKTLEIF